MGPATESARSRTLFLYLFIFGCAGFSLLCRFFSHCGKWGSSLVAVCRLLIVVASLAVEHGF